MEKQTGPVRFLVLEPDPRHLEPLKKLILEAGFGQVRTASSMVEALSVLDSEEIEIVVSSWDLPGWATGLSLLKLVRREERFKRLGFVLISSASDEEPYKVRAARAEQVDGYLLRPIDEQVLKSLLAEVIGKLQNRLLE